MKSIPKSKVSRLLWLGAIIGLMSFGGPSLIHFGYRVATPLSVKQAKTDRYHYLANAGNSLERMELFYWFHARGWDIDEGDEESSWLTPWKELMLHWRGFQ